MINKIERPFFKVSKSFGWHISLKSAMNLLGIMERFERSPLQMLPVNHHAEIKKVLCEIGYRDKIR